MTKVQLLDWILNLQWNASEDHKDALFYMEQGEIGHAIACQQEHAYTHKLIQNVKKQLETLA